MPCSRRTVSRHYLYTGINWNIHRQHIPAARIALDEQYRDVDKDKEAFAPCVQFYRLARKPPLCPELPPSQPI